MILIICVIGAIVGFIVFIIINSDLSLNDVLEGLGSFKPSVNFGINQKVPANYLNLDINADDNTLFEDDVIIGNKNETKSKEKNNNDNEKNKLDGKENNNISDINTEINNIIEEKKENENKENKEKEEKAIEDDDDKLMN